jgi:hypothetical protein
MKNVCTTCRNVGIMDWVMYTPYIRCTHLMVRLQSRQHMHPQDHHMVKMKAPNNLIRIRSDIRRSDFPVFLVLLGIPEIKKFFIR